MKIMRNVLVTFAVLWLGAWGYALAFPYHPPVRSAPKPPVIQAPPVATVVPSSTSSSSATAYTAPKPPVVIPNVHIDPVPTFVVPQPTPTPAPITCSSYTAINPAGWPQTKQVCSDGTVSWH